MFNLEVVYLFQFEVNGRVQRSTFMRGRSAVQAARHRWHFPRQVGSQRCQSTPSDSRRSPVRSMARPTNEERMAEMARAGEENRREVSLAFSSFAHAIDGADMRY